MKNVVLVLQLATSVLSTLGICTYIGLRIGHVVGGIFVGFLLVMAYLVRFIWIKND